MKLSEFFHRQILVARVYGIPVRIDYRWFFVFGLSVWLIADNLQRGTMRLPSVSLPTAIVLSLITTLALFLSVFGHELSHALMARYEGIEIEEIVLHPFGGLARLRSEPDSPRAEFRIAVAGPAASLLFSFFFFGAMAIARIGGYRTTAAIFMFVGFSNLLLAVFNLFPGYPLDGGRVLRAALWRRGGDIAEATRIAGVCGQVIAWTLIVFGAFGVFGLFVPRDPFMGLWSVLVGMFLLDAAVGVVRESQGLKRGTVGEAMSAPISIEPDVLMSHFVDTILPLYRQTSFPVAKAKRLHGILSLEDLKQLPRERWRQVRARDVMRPVAPQLFVDPSTTVARANEIMQRNGVGSVAVVSSTGELVGFLQRGQLKKVKKSKV
ncbi:MAG: site-2 protease family protein [Pyrinomonadaceae bacterium]|nr:site-2 protease family protein [Pyrinomonadaceae bacterium]